MKTSMWTRPRRTAAVAWAIAVMGWQAGQLAADEPELVAALKAAQPNTWTLLPTKIQPAYSFSAPIFVPGRDQVLHWGRPAASPIRNDVLAFDAASGQWTSDYACEPYQPKGGDGAVAANGVPDPVVTSYGACFVPKLKEVIYAGVYAYNVESHKWRQIKPTWVLGGKEYRDIRPMTSLSYAYDPINDELVGFPHHGILGTFESYDNMGSPQMARMPGGHRVVGHYGTMVYSFKDNTWRQTGETMGSEQLRAARVSLLALAGKVSQASDGAYVLRRGRAGAKAEDIAATLTAADGDLAKLSVPDPAKAGLVAVAAPLKEAVAAAGPKEWDAVVAATGRTLWAIDELLDGALRAEPPARTATSMVSDPKSQAIVMFGGQTGLVRNDLKAPQHYGEEPGGLNDTWLYDCKIRQWRNISKANRPPEEIWPRLVRDPASGLILLVRRDAIWGLDVAKEEWSLLAKPAWTGKVARVSTYALHHNNEEVVLDEKRGLLLLLQIVDKQQETWAMRLDAAKMTPQPVAAWTAPPPIRPHVIPPDDPAWMAKLKGLPANTWVDSKANPRPPVKGYTNAACDPVRGHVYFFGGGHGDYQINDVQIYSPGANKWAFAAGDNNDWAPPSGWDGWCMGLRGGANSGHQRNYYSAVDGRMFKSVGTSSARWGWVADAAKDDVARFAYFYDVDRLGVWRKLPVAKLTRDPRAPGTFGWPHMTTPDGQVVGFGGRMEPYNGRFSNHVNFFSYDIYSGDLTVAGVPAPFPSARGEVRPFCFVPDRGKKGQVFVFEFENKQPKTWIYDVDGNAFTEIKPKRQPAGPAHTVEYLVGQGAVYAAIGSQEQWIYSFERNDWVQIPVRADGCKFGFSERYAQLVYSAKYGVLVNLPATLLMRPDVSQVKWE